MGLLLCEFILFLFVFFTGACIFSFLNVIVYRVPRKMSFIRGFSVCPSCGHRLGPADLIPVVSYLALRGRCRYCGARIGPRDTLMELLGGLLAVLCGIRCREPGQAVTVFVFFCILAVAALLDLDTMEIEDACSIAILLLAGVACFTMPGLTLTARLAGMLCVSVPMLALALLIPGAFGGGDIKLSGACGLFLGWKLMLISAALAVLAGGIFGTFLLASGRKGRKDHFAFGPFLCAGMAVGLLFGQGMLDWYLGFLRI